MSNFREILEELKKKTENTEPLNKWFREGYKVITVDELKRILGRRTD